MSNPEEEGTTPTTDGDATAAPNDDNHTSTPSEEDSEPVAAEAAADETPGTDEDTTPEPTLEVTVSESNPVIAHLATLGVDDEATAQKIVALGVGSPDDLAFLTESDLVDAGLPVIQARKLLASMAKVTQPDTAAVPASQTYASLLPAVPTDDSWLSDLRAGGVLKVDESTIVSAIRAALAHRAGLFDVPDLLVERMERFADETDEPVDATFWELRNQLTRRSYGDLFRAIPGMSGNYVTEARKKQLYDRLDRQFWPALSTFIEQLNGWYDRWAQGAANPGMLMQAFLAQQGGGIGLPPGMMAPPDTAIIRDAAAAFLDAANRVFRGTAVQIVSALAFEASQISQTLQKKELPALIGAANREQMLRQLGVAVSASYPRLEASLIQFVLGVVKAQDQPDGQQGLQYFGALYLLGTEIPWNSLERGSGALADDGVTGIGGRPRPRR